jgi:hypothetical protein
VLNVLIGKAGIFGLVPSVGAPIVAAFKDMEEGIDVSRHKFCDQSKVASMSDVSAQLFVASLSDKLQTGGGSIRARAESLFGTFELAINAYSGIHTNEKRRLRFVRRGIVETAA